MRSIITLLLSAAALSAAAQTGEANRNVVVDGEARQVVLSSDYAFAVPESFHADEVSISRSLINGYNTFYLPFAINYSELPSSGGMTYVYADQDNEKVGFRRKDDIEANEPFLMTAVTASSPLAFTDKTFAVTPAQSSDELFAGNYQGTTDAEGLWGIGNDDKFVAGGAGAIIKSFAASLSSLTAGAKSIVLYNDPSGIDDIEADPTEASDGRIFTLSGQQIGKLPARGVVIVNKRKVIVR